MTKLERINLLNIFHKLISIEDQINFILINFKFYEVSQMNYLIDLTKEKKLSNLKRYVKMYPNFYTIRNFDDCKKFDISDIVISKVSLDDIALNFVNSDEIQKKFHINVTIMYWFINLFAYIKTRNLK